MEDSHQRQCSRLWVYPPAVTEVINGLQVKGPLNRTPWEVCSGIPYRDYQMVTMISVIFVIMYGNENSLSASGPTTCLLVPPWRMLLMAAGRLNGWRHPLSKQQWFPLMAWQTSWTWQKLKEHCQTLQYIVISMWQVWMAATGACRRSDQVAELHQAKGDMNDGLIMEADHRPLGPSAGRGEVGRWGPGTVDKPATSETKGEDLLQIARNNAELHGPYNWIGQLTWGGSSCWDSHNPLWSHWPWCSCDQGHWMTYQICVRLNKSLKK